MCGFILNCLLLDAVHIIDKELTGKGIEDRRTANTVVLGQVQVVANAPGDLSFTQHMVVMLMVFQTVDICFHFHGLPP